VSSHKTFRSNNIGSELSGATVVLITEHGDIEITGSAINAHASLVMDSGENIRIDAGHHGTLDESYRRESGWFSGGSLYSETEDLEGRVTRSAVSSRIDAASVRLDAARDIELTGVDISAEDSLSAIARDISVRSASDTETTYSKHTEITVGIDDLAANPGDIRDLVEIEDGKLKLQLGSALYENAESSTRETTAVASLIEAATIQFDAIRDAAGDITIEGSDLQARDSIELNATGDVEVLDSRNEFTRQDLTQKGTAVVNLTLQNEYEQVARATKAVKDAERDLRHAQDAYDQYQDELDAQRAELKRLKQQYGTGTGFVEQADINDFKRQLERMEDDKAFYQTNIALATATLASKTTALIQQTGRAAASSATYGFNLGLDLDIEALEREVDEYYRQSRASNLSANRLSINAGDDAWLRGANLLAQSSIDIVAGDIDIDAGIDSANSRNRQQQVNFGYSWSLMGGASTTDPRELGGNISGEGSVREDESRSYINSQLLAGQVRLTASGDTSIKGANIHADDKLEIVTNNLEVSSVQDIGSTEYHAQGLSYSGAGAGANSAEGYQESLQTRVTRLTGGQVDITVVDHTDLQAAVIASVDAQGADNGQLSLSTNTLRAGSLNNTVDSENRSPGLFAGQTSTLDYMDDNEHAKTRSLATLGNGDIQVNDIERSDTRFLNTDLTDTEVAIYDIDSHRGLSGELDVRMLSEDGRKEIAEDWLKTEMLGNTIELIATTERVGIEDFFDETKKTHATYEAVSQLIAADPGLAAMLQDPGLTPELKQQMLDQVTDAVMLKLGFSPHDNKLIATEQTTPDGSRILGFYSEQTGNAYINDPENDSIRELVVTAGHEASHSIDYKSDIDNSTLEQRHDNNLYAENFGENLASYADFALSSSGYDGLSISNDHIGNDSGLVPANSTNFNSLDHEQGDFRQLHSLEIEWIKRNANRFAAYLCKRSECISQEEAEKRLLTQAFNRVQFGNEGWDALANSFLRQGVNGILPQDPNHPMVGPLTSFYATPEQRANANIYVDEYRKQVAAYQSAGISQPSLEQIIQDAKKHGEYSEKMAENLIKGSLIIGGLVLTPVAAGTPIATELVAFSKNPLGYCMANPAGCTVVAEEAAYTVGGAVSANSLVPEVSISGLSKLSKTATGQGANKISTTVVENYKDAKDVIGKSDQAVVTSTELTPVVISNMPPSLDYTTSSGARIIADPDKTTTLLGNFRSDMSNIIEELEYPKTLDFGEKRGSFNILNTPDSLYKNPDQFWSEYNKPFLDQAILRGDNIILTTKPTQRVMINEETGNLTGFGREIRYLQEHGYQYDSISNVLSPRKKGE